MWDKVKDKNTASKIGGKRYVSGYDLNDYFIKPWTQGTGSCAALLLNPLMPRKAHAFITHSWSEDIEEFVEALNRHYPDGGTSLWICLFSMYQAEDGRGPSIADQITQNCVSTVMSSPSVTSIVVVNTSLSSVFNRLWVTSFCILFLIDDM